jgi:hypothetical protein
MYEKLHEKWNERRNERVHLQCNMNAVLQDNLPSRCPGSKNERASTGSEPISSGSLPRIRMTVKVLSITSKTVKMPV